MVCDDNLIDHLDGFILIMGDKNACNAKLYNHLAKPVAKFGADFCIDCRKRLIEKKYLRIRCKCAGKCHSLTLPAGQLVRITLFHSA